jgi:hypothetical protein
LVAEEQKHERTAGGGRILPGWCCAMLVEAIVGRCAG